MGTGVSPSHSIVTQIAAAEGVAPTDLEPPLHSVVDPDALDRLVASADRRSVDGPMVEFAYRGYRVQVDGNGTVDIEPIDWASASGSDAEPTEDAAGD